METTWSPERIPLFAGLGEPSRAGLLKSAVLHSVAGGTTLFEQGDVPTFQHIVLSGSVHLFGRSTEGREVLIEAVGAPDLVIPAAVAMDAPYLMQARVPEPTQLLMIEAAAFRQAVATEPALAQAMIASLAGQFRRMVRQVKNLKLRPSTNRVGCYLLAQAERQGTPDRAALPYGKHLIASELGMTRENLSRSLSSLQAFGIEVQGEVIIIHDAVKLAAECRPDPLIDGGVVEGAGRASRTVRAQSVD